MTTVNPTGRFSNRVADYVKYRPTYRKAVLTTLENAGVLRGGDVIADIGSGTGLLSRIFLESGYAVMGIEPNAEMRLAGEAELRGLPGFQSINGTAEATSLMTGSVDVVTAGQAFHWFDREKAKEEFRRILRRTGGWVVLVWNERRVGSTEFLVDYERLLKEFATDYAMVDHRRMTPEIIGMFYAPHPFQFQTFENRQVFDLAGVRGRLLSSSYAPTAGRPNHENMLRELERIFNKHQQQGKVEFEYDTEVYFGRAGGAA